MQKLVVDERKTKNPFSLILSDFLLICITVFEAGFNAQQYGIKYFLLFRLFNFSEDGWVSGGNQDLL